MRIWMGPKLVILITDAENADLVLKSKNCLNKPKLFYKPLRDSLKMDGLITLDKDKWRLHRRMVNSILNETSIRPHFNKFMEIIRDTIDILPNDNKSFDVLNYLNVCKISMFVHATLGDSLDSQIRQKYLQCFTK